MRKAVPGERAEGADIRAHSAAAAPARHTVSVAVAAVNHVAAAMVPDRQRAVAVDRLAAVVVVGHVALGVDRAAAGGVSADVGAASTVALGVCPWGETGGQQQGQDDREEEVFHGVVVVSCF